MAATVELAAIIATSDEPETVARRMCSIEPQLSEGGCISFYADSVHGVWAGIYPGDKPCVRISATVNPLRVLDTTVFIQEFQRVIKLVVPKDTFVPIYATPCTVYTVK